MRTPFTYLLRWVSTGFHDPCHIRAQKILLGKSGAQAHPRTGDRCETSSRGSRLARIEEYQRACPDIALAKIRRISFQIQARSSFATFTAFGETAYCVGSAQAHLLALHQHIATPLPGQSGAELPVITNQLRVVSPVTQHAIM